MMQIRWPQQVVHPEDFEFLLRLVISLGYQAVPTEDGDTQIFITENVFLDVSALQTIRNELARRFRVEPFEVYNENMTRH